MALSLGVEVGSTIQVGESKLVVEALLADGTIFVRVGDEQFQITDQRRTQVLPDVYVSCGMPAVSRRDRFSKLAFEAPRHIKILRT